MTIENPFTEYGKGFYDGYDAPEATLPAVVSEHDSASWVSGK